MICPSFHFYATPSQAESEGAEPKSDRVGGQSGSTWVHGRSHPGGDDEDDDSGGEDNGNDDSGEDDDQGARNYADLASTWEKAKMQKSNISFFLRSNPSLRPK